jgi:CRP-like cAMP-binding protein
VAHNRLAYLTANDWTILNTSLHRRTFTLGDEIIHQGSFGDRIFIIRQGEASVELTGTTNHVIVATLGPDDICGDMAFLERGRSTASVIARDVDVQVDEIMAGDLREIFEAFPRLGYRFYLSLSVILARRLRDTSRALAAEMIAAERRS